MKIGMNEGLDEIDILEIIGEVSNGIIHLHLQEPPIAHRDLKVRYSKLYIIITS